MIRRAAVAAAVAAACACAPFVHKDRWVRVLVYNIHAGKDAAGQANLEQVAALVDSTDADIVLLQEVDRGTKRSGGVDQLQVLMDRTDFAGVFGKSLDYDGGGYGIAALSRNGFGYQDTQPLPVTPPQERAGGSHEPRALLITVAHTRRGRWQALTTHLDASRGDEYRLQEAEELHALLKQRLATATPLLIGGDFNSTPDSAVYRKLTGFGLRDAWSECGQGDGFTFPADKPVKRIDYLFLTGTLTCTAAQVIDTQASDHRPLLVTVASSPAAAAKH
jgi:endonuclease/exonuclease/phosphatase family metal-dependent hydrolase